MFNNIMRDWPPNNNNFFPLLLLLLLLTSWTPGGWMVDGSSQTRIGRTPSAAIERGDWKPIDYGHPMRDPTLVYGADFSRKFQDGESDRALAKFSIRTNYRQVKTPDENTENIITTNSIRLVPPVVDPVHYGIQSAEPLWPIRGHQLPPFMLPSEAVESAAAADQHRREWTRLRPAFRSDEKDGPPILLRQEVQAKPFQQARDNAVQHRQPQDKRWSAPIRPQKTTAYPRHPVQSTVWTWQPDRPPGRAPATIRPSLTSTPGSDVASRTNQLESLADPATSELEARRKSSSAHADDDGDVIAAPSKKRAKRPFFHFFIQQGHSKVRKYGTA